MSALGLPKSRFNVGDPEYPRTETGTSKSRFVIANTGQINTMKKQGSFGVSAGVPPVRVKTHPSGIVGELRRFISFVTV